MTPIGSTSSNMRRATEFIVRFSTITRTRQRRQSHAEGELPAGGELHGYEPPPHRARRRRSTRAGRAVGARLFFFSLYGDAGAAAGCWRANAERRGARHGGR